MTAYYNEIDPFAADWLEELIKAGQIAPGVVDRRSIEDVAPSDLAGFTQCHFFAGIGVWSYVLRRAGWADDRPIWTASCPCQPFSAAGKGGGFDDERHLWPALFHLAVLCGPRVIVGEQVSSKDGLAWLDLVSADVETTGYAFGALDLCAAGVGAPHIRQRAYWLAHDTSGRWREERTDVGRGGQGDGTQGRLAGLGGGGSGRLADDDNAGLEGRGRAIGRDVGSNRQVAARGSVGRLADTGGERRRQDARGASRDEETDGREGRQRLEPNGDHVAGGDGADCVPGPTNGAWGDADWLLCRDPSGPRWRPVEPGTFPLAHGIAARVGRLRGYGNAIVAPLAEEFVKVVKEIIDEGY